MDAQQPTAKGGNMENKRIDFHLEIRKDLDDWLREESKRLDVPRSGVVRYILREVMDYYSLNLHLPQELNEWIERERAKRGLSKTGFVRNKLWEAKEREDNSQKELAKKNN